MTFEQFSTKRFEVKNNNKSAGYNSLEFLHDNIHGWTGGPGYMGDPARSAFDPIFW